MRTVSVFKNGNNRAIRLPKDFDFDGVNELEIIRDGDSLILRPAKPNWISFKEEEKADDDFLIERNDVIEDGRVIL
ncbi:type II toxin-antitoxin system VapB family antitoxin [Xenorhabdus bovienii]|uniref:Type II toxin-antitoxin system VapB family antitoxin n=1 Tax=Xenorhabdus bovienii TaxID=40576 RepID=A0AAJ1J6G6_XENBV|nr:type II toxin-antitoxin system VapB family antitoxin [Xenorhabdus bovienii]MDE1473897.1 type II toxin-antitoxin system VapB family antitoxin [Xenorhabdus bovienii]MDE1478005.1 type II toxin-antitoxin system VapB family antitoxin [Xenorhabdus bovienii]MDE1482949.1 type II toxin-antitoxin system VapB family antitoxin [Xenorhabdus bovienii]MDE1487279.1 type II toxin-antitoxin system VapB family antitoxin [Xenorhabdus bovienii]MDE1491563.1 type II toxin-antitoxin system VapB family antitoxin [X